MSLISVVAGDGTVTVSDTINTYTKYDKNGNTLAETSSVQRGSISSDSTATIQYDELGRVIERTDGCGKSIEKVRLSTKI